MNRSRGMLVLLLPLALVFGSVATVSAVILIVVVSLLTLFAVVGVSFTYYADVRAVPMPSTRLEMSFEEKRREQHSGQVSGDAPREPVHVGPAQFVIIKLVVLFAVAIPISALIATVFHRLFRVNYEVVGMITAALLAFLISSVHQAIVNRVIAALPTADLTKHFGTKVDATIQSLRGRKRGKSHPK